MSVESFYARRERLQMPGRPRGPIVFIPSNKTEEAPEVELVAEPVVETPPAAPEPAEPNPILDALRARQTIRPMIRAACCACGVTMEELLSLRRAAGIVDARQTAAWLLRTFSSLSYPAIGRYLGGRDHTTILHSCRRIDHRILVAGAVLPMPNVENDDPGDWERCLEMIVSLPRVRAAYRHGRPIVNAGGRG